MMMEYKKKEIFEGRNFPFHMTIQKEREDLVGLHWHEHLEFIKVLRGKVLVTLGNKTFYAIENDIIYVQSCQIHSVCSVSEPKAEILGMVFDKLFPVNTIEGFETNYMYSFFLHCDIIESKIDKSHLLWTEINECLQKSYEEYSNRKVCYDIVIKSNIYKLISVLIRYCRNELQGLDGSFESVNEFVRMKPVFDYIDRHYSKRIYLQKICQLINISPFYFARLFKKVSGKTLMEYVNHVRVNAAMRFLMDSNMAITEISEKSGFCNINYLDKLFKKYTGVTPLEYRNRIRSRKQK